MDIENGSIIFIKFFKVYQGLMGEAAPEWLCVGPPLVSKLNIVFCCLHTRGELKR